MKCPIVLCHNCRMENKCLLSGSKLLNFPMSPNMPYYEGTCLLCPWPCLIGSYHGPLVSWDNFPFNSFLLGPQLSALPGLHQPTSISICAFRSTYLNQLTVLPKDIPSPITWRKVLEGRASLKMGSPCLPCHLGSPSLSCFQGLLLQSSKAARVHAHCRYRLPHGGLKRPVWGDGNTAIHLSFSLRDLSTLLKAELWQEVRVPGLVRVSWTHDPLGFVIINTN